ncbi:MAG: hypothetical protein KKF50_02710 [Nanoarchaeota archaeon]|nr:hypothetical protein [Nanoarchaeota archaeon]
MVNQLKNSLRWDSKSLHHIECDQFTRYFKEYAFADKIIFDRSHISEEVYSKLWRNGTSFQKNEKEVLDKILEINGLIIFACPNIETLQDRHSSRNFSQQIKYSELEKSRELFIEELSNHHYLIYLSKSYEELDKLIKKVKEMVK